MIVTSPNSQLNEAVNAWAAEQQAQISSLDLRQEDLQRAVDSATNRQSLFEERLSRLERRIAEKAP